MIDDYSGQNYDDVKDKLEELGLEVKREEEVDNFANEIMMEIKEIMGH